MCCCVDVSRSKLCALVRCKRTGIIKSRDKSRGCVYFPPGVDCTLDVLRIYIYVYPMFGAIYKTRMLSAMVGGAGRGALRQLNLTLVLQLPNTCADSHLQLSPLLCARRLGHKHLQGVGRALASARPNRCKCNHNSQTSTGRSTMAPRVPRGSLVHDYPESSGCLTAPYPPQAPSWLPPWPSSRAWQ